MRQMILKASYGLGWASHDYRISLGGFGASPTFETFGVDSAKIVVPIAGTFSNLTAYSPAGAHPDYTIKLAVNGAMSTLQCALPSGSSQSSDITHSVAVVAGDDIYISVDVNPLGSGIGYPLNVSIEFESTQQFYGVSPLAGGQTAGTYDTAGALGNGNFQTLSVPSQLSNTYSICTTPGNIIGMRMKTYSTNAGGSWTGYLTKNQVLQDGSGGTVNTALVLTDGTVQASKSFSLPLAIGDHLDFALIRNTTDAVFNLANVAMSCIFAPTDAKSFMCCGGNNDANMGPDQTDYKWVQSEQQIAIENIAKCPIGPRGIVVNGLRIELPIAPTIAGTSRIFTIRKNGVDTAATLTITGNATSGVISGLNIAFSNGDYIDLKIVNVGDPTVGNGLKWGLSVIATIKGGLYTTGGTHDKYYDIEKKIPDPIVRTALLGD
jgi:hypothetical protein